VGDYFGYTQGSVVLETKLKFEKEASVVVQSEKKLPVEVNARVNVCKTSGFGYTFVFLVLGIVIILGWIFVYRLRKKEKKKSASIAMHASMLIPTPMDLVSVNAWRYEEALKRSGDDSTLLNSRIDSFIQNLPHMLFELKKLRTSGDFVNLILQAHLLKSSSAGIAAHSLRIACKNLEISAREKSSLLVEKNFTKVESMAKETLALLKEHRGKNRTEIKSPQDVTVSLDEQLTIIEQKIQQNIFVDTEAFSLFKETLGEGLAITVKEFKQRIDKLEYEKALEQLGLIRGELI
jgi:HPt (histidine-containing phosphotransfer) domain-containing protein